MEKADSIWQGRAANKIILFIFFILLFISPLLISTENRLIVTAKIANIYLNPDINSSVIETVKNGAVLNLLSGEKTNKIWYYVSFYSEERGINISGFIYVSLVKKMGEITEIIEEEKPDSPVNIKEVLFKSPKKIKVVFNKSNIRFEPDFKSQIIHQVEIGITLQSVGKKGEWYKVNLRLKEDIVISGYIHQSFVREIRKED